MGTSWTSWKRDGVRRRGDRSHCGPSRTSIDAQSTAPGITNRWRKIRVSVSMRRSSSPSPDPREEKWPLVVSFFIALPIVVGFALGLARGAKDGEVRPILVSYLFSTLFILLVLAGVSTVVMRWRVVRSRRRSASSGARAWGTPSVEEEHLDVRDRSSRAIADRNPPPSRELSVGPGLSLYKRYRRPLPKPQRRI